MCRKPPVVLREQGVKEAKSTLLVKKPGKPAMASGQHRDLRGSAFVAILAVLLAVVLRFSHTLLQQFNSPSLPGLNTTTLPTSSEMEGPLETESHQYAIVIDAGSTGSRLFVYRFFYRAGVGRREIECVTSKKATPGLSSFEKTPELVSSYLQPLFDHAATVVPPELQSQTLIYLQATAGMRLISEANQELIYDTIYRQLGQDEKFPFKLLRSNIGTLSGRMEGYYAALSANYLTGRINTELQPQGKHKEAIVGALDMGGSSTQIVFQHVEDNRMELDESDFWVQSYLAYGVDTIRYRLWSHLVRDAPVDGDVDIDNPCTFVGHVEQFKGYRLLGTGKADECAKEIRRMLWEDLHETCSPNEPCGLDGIRHPPLSGQFLAMSVFFFALDCMKQLGPIDLPHWPSPSIDEIEAAAHRFCSQDWSTINSTRGAHSFTSDGLLGYRCVEVVYIHTLLKHGYGFPGDSRNITFVLNIEGMEVEWTLGYALAEVPLDSKDGTVLSRLLATFLHLSTTDFLRHPTSLLILTAAALVFGAVVISASRRSSSNQPRGIDKDIVTH